MLKPMKARIQIFIAILMVLILPGSFCHGQTEPALEDILEGFETSEDKKESSEEKKTDDILEGFDDNTIDTKAETEAVAKIEKPDRFSLDGYFTVSSVYSLIDHEAAGSGASWDGLSRLRSELKLEVDARLSATWKARISGHGFYDFAYAINGRENYSDDVLENYEKELEMDEVYVAGSLTQALDLKAGRQIVVWGRSDNIRISDVLNPLDLREPGLVDIEKIRLPVTMTRLDYYLKKWHFSGVVVHEVRYNKNPEFGSDFFPGSHPLPERQSPEEGFDLASTQFAAAVSGIFRKWDLSIYFADVYANNGYLDVISTASGSALEVEHARLKMLGGAFNVAMGNWLIKGESAYFDGLAFTNAPDEEYSRLDGLLGAEYAGFSDATLSLEIANRHLFDFDEKLENSPDYQKENLVEWALRVVKPFLNETLTLTFLANTFGLTGDQGALQRFTAEYDWSDSIVLTGGLVFYQSGDLRRTMAIGDNDRIYFDIQYHF